MSDIEQINAPISIETVGDIALVCIDSPPVNATGIAVREGLQTAMRQLNKAGRAQVIVIYCAGRTFIAGADIREFGKPPLEPHLPDLCNEIEASAIPVISVLHGTTLGGGLEVAMATHARIGIKGLKVGLPEVLLGILPGAGGTQRAPRLVGVPAALGMITTGRHIPAAEALEMGLLDGLVEGAPRDVALAAAQDVVDGKLATRRTDQITVVPDQGAIDALAEKLRVSQPNLFSVHKCVEAVAAATRPLTEGLAIERDLFWQCMQTPQRDGLIHAFFAERAVANVPEKKVTPRDVNAIGVIGGGTMGSGIATSALLAGLSVTLIELKQEALDRGVATITKNLEGAVKRGKLAEAKFAATLENLTPSTDMKSLAEADLVVEAVFEDMAVKKQIFAALDAICKPSAVLASNTSYLDINEIAAATKRPESVLGLHFFSPAHVMRLLEVVVADKTAPETTATGFLLAKKMRKIAVRAGVCDGFIGNRIMTHYGLTAAYLMMDGASPQQIDSALEGFGFAMGPYRVGDLAGLDIGWASRKRKAPDRPPEERYIEINDRICEQGWFGRKTGKGFYIYEGKSSVPNPEVATIIEDERTRAGVIARDFTDAEIVDRYMTAMIAESARVLEDGIALRPVDIDAVFLFGYGFPRFRGGPLQYADTLGAAEIVKRIKTYAEEDPHYWRVPALLETMAENGTTFADLNKGV
ncbi:MAG: 3-hydroxyacyl-CoA dehydrogenase NAD-binding domain-containing protein [Rhodobacterales bacterium]|nr:3-hydroxyacyl-CoA dehydrogenase NAD-binding domain-containing protein [Rhodobacterales bacterium]